jgi:hypothetical protein
MFTAFRNLAVVSTAMSDGRMPLRICAAISANRVRVGALSRSSSTP